MSMSGKEEQKWRLGTLHDDGAETVWEGYDSLTLTSLLMSAYRVIDDEKYHPLDCPEKVAIWGKNPCNAWEMIWLEPDES